MENIPASENASEAEISHNLPLITDNDHTVNNCVDESSNAKADVDDVLLQLDLLLLDLIESSVNKISSIVDVNGKIPLKYLKDSKSVNGYVAVVASPEIEKKILFQMNKLRSTDAIISCLQRVGIVERLGIFDEDLNSGLSVDSLKIHNTLKKCYLTHMKHPQNNVIESEEVEKQSVECIPIAFSYEFHKQMMEDFNLVIDNLTDSGSLKREIGIRLQLLRSYSSLIETNENSFLQDNYDATYTSLQKAKLHEKTKGSNEETRELAAECSKNTLKAEALSWIIRAARFNQRNRNKGIKSTKPKSIVSPDKSSRDHSPVKNAKILISRQNNTARNEDHLKLSRTREVFDNLGLCCTKIVPFSLFYSCHVKSSRDNCSVHSQSWDIYGFKSLKLRPFASDNESVLNILEMQEIIERSKSTQYNPTLNNHMYSYDIDSNTIGHIQDTTNSSIDINVVNIVGSNFTTRVKLRVSCMASYFFEGIVSFVLIPLLSDMFASNSYAFKAFGSQPNGAYLISQLLPSVIDLFELLPLKMLTKVLLKQPSTSPLQRYTTQSAHSENRLLYNCNVDGYEIVCFIFKMR
jgi:hypothetical protein